MTSSDIFDSETMIPDAALAKREKSLLGFDARYASVRDQLRLLLSGGELSEWSRRHYGNMLPICERVADQYPLVIFHGDVGTGKTAMAECIANKLMTDARAEESMLFRLSNRVRGSGKVGEMGTLLTDAFQHVVTAAGKSRRAVLVIDEADSLAASRTQDHSHHEDKVAVNTLIQSIDDLRRYGGRIAVILCTNRLSAVDPALVRRAAIVQKFERPSEIERSELLQMDLAGLGLKGEQIAKLVTASGPSKDGAPGWTFSDFRTRFYPSAIAMAFPAGPLSFEHLMAAAAGMSGSRVMEDR